MVGLMRKLRGRLSILNDSNLPSLSYGTPHDNGIIILFNGGMMVTVANDEDLNKNKAIPKRSFYTVPLK
ncbi:hypothetical protein Y032_0940g3139 [Ancylostoma ceylanicum]|uniref:Uncharacterized protein n=1 Tax=Ancylostoma ceylanicum TaxID=53326 RepID=A0A016W8A7_9BILA|nr:hypothetical protein Y032_0940g3139 [Ancylostoma ceylanicum]